MCVDLSWNTCIHWQLLPQPEFCRKWNKKRQW